MKADISYKLKNAAHRINSEVKFHRSVKFELLSLLPFENASQLELAEENDVLDFLASASFPFSESEMNETARFILNLGKGTLEEQIRLSESFIDFWTQIHTEAKTAYDKKSRLCLTLGGLAGLATAIVLM